MAAGYERQWEARRGGRSVADLARDSYYGRPVIHRPHWKWLIISYFFLGGIAGASHVIAAVAQLAGGREGRPIVRVGRYLSLAALLPSPILLILDLGRPARFHHMLRVVKFRSPMSVGTWGLLVFSAFSGLLALAQAAEDGLLGRSTGPARLLRALPTRPLALLGSGPAFFVGGYTGVLLAATAVPLWTKNYRLMGPLFLASAMSSAAAAIALALALTRSGGHATLRRLERLDSLSLLAELGLLLAFRAGLGPVIGRPLAEGRLSRLYRLVLGLGIGLPLALQARGAVLGAAPARPITALAALLVLAGGFLFRYLIVMAGRASADDPQATFELTGGERSTEAQVRGASRAV